jgi:hypothetical protein
MPQALCRGVHELRSSPQQGAYMSDGRAASTSWLLSGKPLMYEPIGLRRAHPWEASIKSRRDRQRARVHDLYSGCPLGA